MHRAIDLIQGVLACLLYSTAMTRGDVVWTAMDCWNRHLDETRPALSDFGVVGFMARTRIAILDDTLSERLDKIQKRMAFPNVPEKVALHQEPIPVTLLEAADYLNRHVCMAYAPSVCVETDEGFFFSGGMPTNSVNDFSCGIAIRKADGAIGTWAQADGADQPQDETRRFAEKTTVDGVLSDWEQLQRDLREADGLGDRPAWELRRIGLEMRWRIAEQGCIPQWDGTQLRDVADSLCGAAKLDEEERRLLAKLNYWEQAFGLYSIPPEFRGRMASLGEERAAIEWYVRQLEKKSVRVELDTDDGLWKVGEETE